MNNMSTEAFTPAFIPFILLMTAVVLIIQLFLHVRPGRAYTAVVNYYTKMTQLYQTDQKFFRLMLISDVVTSVICLVVFVLAMLFIYKITPSFT